MKISDLILGVLSLVAYSQANPGESNEFASTLPLNNFALTLFQKLRSTEGNLLFSPLSAHSALSMVYTGSSNETATEMNSALWLGPGSPTESTRGYSKFLGKVLKSEGGVSLRLANRVFADKSRKVKESFKKFLKDNFLADAEELDFKGETEKSRKTINEWVEKQTMYKIHNLIEEGDLIPETLSVLVNAMYFKGNWSVAFPKRNTLPRPFRLNSKKAEEVDMMSVTDYFNYAEYPEFQILFLNYQGNDTSLVIMLPKDVDGLPRLEAALPTLNWNEIERRLQQKRKINVALPKFKFEQTTDLVPLLKKMGMKRAFDPELAQFPEMSDYPTVIDKVVQKAFIEVDETGTEAAAATYVGGFTLITAELIPQFTADHPFLFFIWHKPSQTVLFMGRYSVPLLTKKEV